MISEVQDGPDEPEADLTSAVAAEETDPSTPVEDGQGAAEVPARDTEDARGRALRLAELCDEYRTERTVVLDLSAVTPVFDYFVITTGTNPRQMSALADEADKTMKAAGSPKFGTEGHAGRQWILHDYGDVVLHILSEQARSTYDLEGLWADATPVEFASAAAADGHAEGDAGPAEA